MDISSERIKLKEIEKVKFRDEEVLIDVKQQIARKLNLKKAMQLGNLYKRKVKLYFRTLEGTINSVKATVWSVGDEFVAFKGGVHVPIKSITEIEFG